MKFSDAMQRAKEIQDAAEGNTIPGDPDHGRWQKVASPAHPVAEPLAPHLPPPLEAAPSFPVRSLSPISVAPDNLRQFNNLKGVPVRRVFSPSPL